jgi:hypothetical protein
MTPEERIQLLELYEQAKKVAFYANKKVEELKNRLATGCPHPKEHVKPYQWEHDNGYGRQSMVDGKHCSICGAIDSWGRGMFTALKDLHVDY